MATLDFVTENTLMVTLSQRNYSVVPLKTGNVIVASFVTSYAHLHLFEFLNQLRDGVLYYDTDSVIYSSEEDQEELEENDWTVEFCSTSPKCYSFKMNKNQEVIHVK